MSAASRVRDFVARFISDTSRFDTSDAGSQLEDLSRGAQTTGADLEQLGRDSERAGRDVATVGEDASRAGRAGRDVKELGEDAERGARDVKDLGETADRTARDVDQLEDDAEAAGTFSGSADDITAELAAEIDSVGGNIDRVDLASKVHEWGLEIADNKSWWEVWQKSSVTNLEQVQRKAQETGVDFQDLFAGMSGYDQAAAGRAWDELTTKIEDYNDRIRRVSQDQSIAVENRGRAIMVLDAEKQAYVDVRAELERASGLTAEATRTQQLLTEATGVALATQEAYGEALGDVADSSSTMADATEEAARRAGDANATVVLSIDDVLAAQQRQLEAAANLEANTRAVYERLGQDAVDLALAQGDQADEAMALLANAPVEQGQQIAANYRRLGEMSAADLVAGITGRREAAATAGRGVGESAGEALAQGIRARERAIYDATAAALLQSLVRNGPRVRV